MEYFWAAVAAVAFAALVYWLVFVDDPSEPD